MKINFYKIFLSLLIFIFAGSLGSFYQVFVTRREKKEDFIFSRSHCDSCKRTLSFYELIPVFSYVFLGGKCASCGEKIGKDKFLIELFISTLSLIIFMKYKVSFETFIIIGIIVVAVFIGIIDYKTSYIYNVDLLIIFLLSLAYKYFLHLGFLNSLKYSLGMGLIFFAIYYFTSMMGLGDVYYSFIMGFFAENLYEAFILFRDSFISAAVISIFLILSKKKSFKDSIAFGPFMSLAIIIFLICRWLMFEKIIIIKINDGFINLIEKTKNEKEIKTVPIAYRIYKDGKILDYHHFFYKCSKIVEKAEINKRDKVYILFDSSEIIHINYKIPEIEESDIKNFLELELEDYGDFDINNYEIFYKDKKSNDSINLSIDLVPKDMILKLKDLFEKLNINNFEIYPETQSFSLNGKFIEIAPSYIKEIFVKDNLVNSYEKIYDENIEKLIEDNNLEEQNASNIINLRYDPEEQKVEEDFLFKYKNYFIKHISQMEKFSKGESVKLFGNICDSKAIKDTLKAYSNLDFEILDDAIYSIDGLKKEDKAAKKVKNKNYINILLPFALLAIIAFNLIYSNNLKRKYEEKSESVKMIDVEESDNKDLSSDKFQEKNKKFIDKITEIQKLEDENLVLTYYNFDNGRMTVRGIVKDEAYFNKAFKDFDIVSKNFYKENGFNKFEMQIK